MKFNIKLNTNWVVCAAGKGSRFSNLGVVTPKPQIILNGMSFLERSLSCLDVKPKDRIIIITNKENKTIELKSRVSSLYPWAQVIWVELNKHTKGQLDTFYHARKALDLNFSTVIWNSDTYFKSDTLSTMMKNEDIDAIVPCGKIQGNQWSFFEPLSNKDLRIVKAREKVKISPWASVGLYYFKNTENLLKITKKCLTSKLSKNVKEYYVSNLYNEDFLRDQNTMIAPVDIFKPFGTIAEVKKHWGISLKELIADNPPGTIVIDLDNTITIDDKVVSYEFKKPNKAIIKKMKEYASQGYRIIIYTARNMKTQNGDESMVIGNIGLDTLNWLQKHKVPFDGLKFGKPFADNAFYIDDKAIRPNEFLEFKIDKLQALVKNG
ncbi:MAG: capsule biosynthesis phosphatase [Thermoproteota archaeon]